VIPCMPRYTQDMFRCQLNTNIKIKSKEMIRREDTREKRDRDKLPKHTIPGGDWQSN